MKRILRICLALSLLASAPAILGQDAAAPFRRTSPTPAPEESPAAEPTETPREQERQEEEEPPRRAEPAATPTPARAEQPRTATPTPAAQTQTPAQATKPARRVLQVEPVRAVEPRPPGLRRPRPAESQDDPDRRDAEPPKPRKQDDEPARSESARPPKPAKRERDDDADRPPAPAARGNRGATLDYWDDDPGSAVKNLERRWQKALVSKDVDTINDLLASDFVATSSTGKVGSKSTLLNAIRRDKNEYKSADARGMSVRMLGPRVAVVTGVATESGTTPDGRSFRNSRRFTDTWMLRNGKWVCVASQATELPNG